MLLRLQPVEPLSLMVCRLKPPTNEPQGILAALSRSPMFLLVIWTCALGLEHTSPNGSTSPVNVKLPSLFRTPASPAVSSAAITETGVPAAAGNVAPLVCPENISSAPGVDGPKVSLQELSLIAKFWA